MRAAQDPNRIFVVEGISCLKFEIFIEIALKIFIIEIALKIALIVRHACKRIVTTLSCYAG